MRNDSTAQNGRATYFTVFQTQVRNTTHGRRLSFCQLFINLVDPIRNVVVRFVE